MGGDGGGGWGVKTLANVSQYPTQESKKWNWKRQLIIGVKVKADIHINVVFLFKVARTTCKAEC